MKKLLLALTAAVLALNPRPALSQDKDKAPEKAQEKAQDKTPDKAKDKAPEKTPIVRKIERLDPRFDKLVPKDAKMEELADGFVWAEGPVWIKDGGFLLFSDIPPNTIHKWDGKELKRDFIKPSGYTGDKPRGGEPGSNGLTVNADGLLTLCEHGDRRVTQMDKTFSKKTTLADKYNGKRFNSPNDLVYHSNGDLYFTDPPYGLEKGWEDPARELDFCGVYRLKGGKVELLIKDMSRPNGIALSPIERTLYVANSDKARPVWMAYPLFSDGSIGQGRVFFDASKLVAKGLPGLPDGLRVDLDGNIFATGPGGVLVFSPDGTHLGTLNTGVPTANCGWGDDGSTLYITANTGLLRIRLTTKGKI